MQTVSGAERKIPAVFFRRPRVGDDEHLCHAILRGRTEGVCSFYTREVASEMVPVRDRFRGKFAAKILKLASLPENECRNIPRGVLATFL